MIDYITVSTTSVAAEEIYVLKKHTQNYEKNTNENHCYDVSWIDVWDNAAGDLSEHAPSQGIRSTSHRKRKGCDHHIRPA